MITLIRNTDGSIKTYSEIPDGFEALSPGESVETSKQHLCRVLAAAYAFLRRPLR